MNSYFATTLITTATIASFAGASNIYKVDSGLTSSTLFGGDRQLNTMGFLGSSSTFNGSNFLHWVDGSLTNNAGTFGWNDSISRDIDSSNVYSGNPDRADSATPFSGEGSASGTLKEVFGPFGSGYKNMSYIIDGEDNAAWHMDLILANGSWFTPDADTGSVELSVLERGGNSDFNIYGIKADGTLTSALFVSRNVTGATGWKLDTLEIGGSQNVHGVGISLDSSWGMLKGFRVEAKNGFNGPDIVALGVVNPVPAPGALALLAVAGVVGRRRRSA